MIIDVPDIQVEWLDYRRFLPLQGDFKFLDQRGFQRLENSFKEFGGFVPKYVWKKGEHLYILDGHQSTNVWKKNGVQFRYSDGRMGYVYPCIVVEAANLQEAKKKLLVIDSSYGERTQEGFDDFTYDLGDEWLKETTQFGELLDLDLLDEKGDAKAKGFKVTIECQSADEMSELRNELEGMGYKVK